MYCAGVEMLEQAVRDLQLAKWCQLQIAGPISWKQKFDFLQKYFSFDFFRIFFADLQAAVKKERLLLICLKTWAIPELVFRKYSY